jgi:hypothetical protein
MYYPWAIAGDRKELDAALKIVMDYLEMKDAAGDYYAVQKLAADTILNDWRRGVRHPVRMANSAIVAVENGIVALPSAFPRLIG